MFDGVQVGRIVINNSGLAPLSHRESEATVRHFKQESLHFLQLLISRALRPLFLHLNSFLGSARKDRFWCDEIMSDFVQSDANPLIFIQKDVASVFYKVLQDDAGVYVFPLHVELSGQSIFPENNYRSPRTFG